MNILITGAAGFLGSALANKLVQEGHQVRGYDDCSAGDPNVLRPEVFFTRGDVNDRPKLWTMLQEVDVVFHLAARVSVPESILYPREYNHVNVGGTVSLMEAIRDVGNKRIIFISSGTVYGEQKGQFFKEDAETKPHSPYAVSKLAAEYYVRSIGAASKIESVILRVFNAYGPGQMIPASHAPVIPSFIRQAIRNGTIVVNGDGNQTRDYVYVDDVVTAMVAAATAPKTNGLVINIGSGQSASLKEVVKKILELTGGRPQVVYNTRVDGGVSHMRAEVFLALKKLNYKPSIDLETGLRLTVERDPRFSIPEVEEIDRRR